jgi:DHA2 family multidrug resistance protein-like MFS transporter
VGSAPPEKAGSASGISETSGEFGIALGVASMGSIGTAVYRSQLADSLGSGLPRDAVDAARESIAGAAAAAAQLPDGLGDDLLAAARDAFTDGLNLVAGLSAGLFLVLAVVAAVLFRHLPPHGHPAAGDGLGDAERVGAPVESSPHPPARRYPDNGEEMDRESTLIRITAEDLSGASAC